MSYAVKECFRTLQGEGARTGRVAVFCRMAGCNLWSGREPDRERSACAFCDTDFVGTDGPGGGTFETASELAAHVAEVWGDMAASLRGVPYVVFTGGEPLLQLDDALVEACHAKGLEVGVETNGTLRCPAGVDWICVSPKALEGLVQRSGSELKLVYPQASVDPVALEGLEFEHFFVQPMDGPDRERSTRACVELCLARPRWRLSLQTHKLLGIP